MIDLERKPGYWVLTDKEEGYRAVLDEKAIARLLEKLAIANHLAAVCAEMNRASGYSAGS